MFGPVPKIPSHKLFRLLLQRPRPTWPIRHRLRSALGAGFCVQGLRGPEVESILDIVPSDITETDERHRIISPEVIVASLLTVRKQRVFSSVDEIGSLDDDEFQELSSSVFAALAIVSPTYERSDVDRWSKALGDGAEHVSNLREALAIGACRDDHGERPDRYFGLPLADLTDGQLMAYRAACELLTKAQRSKEQKRQGM